MMDVSHLKDNVELISALLGVLGIFLGGIWKVVSTVQKVVNVEKIMTDKILSIGKAIREIGGNVRELTVEVAELRVEVRTREKESMRVEGRLEATNEILMKTLSDLRSVSDGMRAIWTNLHKLAPDKIPRRLTDDQ